MFLKVNPANFIFLKVKNQNKKKQKTFKFFLWEDKYQEY